MLQRAIFIVIFLSTSHKASSQIDYDRLQFYHLDQPLTQNLATCFIQDHKGFFWIGTDNGLNRYDGINIKTYKHHPKDTNSLASNIIFTLFEDSKHNLWVITPNALSLYDRAMDQFISFGSSLSNDNDSYADEFGDTIFEENGQLGLIFNGQLTYFDLTTRSFTNHSWVKDLNLDSWKNSYPRSIYRDSKERLWLLVYHSIFLFDVQQQQFNKVIDGDTLSNDIFLNVEFQMMQEDLEGTLWLAGMEAGLLKLVDEAGKVSLENYSKKLELGQQKVEIIFIDDENILWFPDENKALYVLRPNRTQVHRYIHKPQEIHSISSISVKSLYQDQTGRIWVGNYSTGVDYINPYENKFKNFKANQSHNSISYNNVSSFLEDQKGNIWIGTDGGGLNYYNTTDNTFKVYKHEPNDSSSLSADAIVSMTYGADQTIWIAHWEGGISILDTQNFTFRQLNTNNSGLLNNKVMSIAYDGKHNYFIGTYGDGLHIYNSLQDDWTYLYPRKDSTFILEQIHTICIGDKDRVWVGGPRGLIKMTFNTKQEIALETFRHNGNENDLSNNNISCIFKDRKGRIWSGTHYGLNKLSDDEKYFTTYTTEEGLADNFIQALVEDDNGDLWVSSLNGLSKLSTKSDTIAIRNYTLADGLQERQFNRGAILKTSSSDLYFGGVNGFNIIHPAKLVENPFAPPVVLTDFKIFNKSVIPSSDATLKKQINATDTIVLTHQQSVFSFEFAALNYTHPERNQYAYKLEGFDNDWYYIGNNHNATFTSIPSGTYQFKVKAANNDGIWNEEGKSVLIIIRPPWWRTQFAYLLYVLSFLGLSYVIRRIVLLRFEFRQREQLLEKEREIDQLKLKFFTNISHEFRTPLTLILAPLDVLKTARLKPIYQSQIELIQRNTIRLQRLINQLLDLRAIEKDGYALYLQEADLIVFLKGIFEVFQPLAQQQEMTYQFHTQLTDLNCYFDEDILDKVIYNLLSNAFKYTPSGGTIRLEVQRDESKVKIVVIDNGIGIAVDQQAKIFDRFFRADTPDSNKDGSTGIGLSLAKELIERHKGRIQFSSVIDVGSTFEVIIPIDESIYHKEDFSAVMSNENNEKLPTALGAEMIVEQNIEPNIESKPKVYVVDDNEDLRYFLAQQLQQDFDLSTFKSGLEALHKAVEAIPDLIISDVMMPVMDGVSFCKAIKENSKTCHIPVLLLTAKSSEEKQLEGLGAGADAYVLKPFSYPILKAKVDSLLLNRQKIWNRLKEDKFIAPEKLIKGSKDKAFIQKLTELIHAHIDDPKLNYVVLTKEIAMSRAQLYRKVSSLTGQSVHEFIKIVRLKKAAQLLKEENLSISEIAFKVGFKHTSNFSSAFKSFFGSSPRQYKKM